MSDEYDSASEDLLAKLLILYSTLRAVCEELPVPIQLPRGAGRVGDLIQAVDRCFVIAKDQPIPEDQIMDLELSCLHWLAASDLIGIHRGNVGGYDHRANAAHVVMIGMEMSLQSLIDWVKQQ